jgi:hypothetical protein
MKTILVLILMVTFTNCNNMIQGKLMINNSPLPNQEILFIDTSGKKILGSAFTNKEGIFNLKGEFSGKNPIDVLFKIKENELTSIYHRTITDKKEIDLNIDTSTFFDIVINIKSNVGYPKQLNIFIDPLAFDDVPDHLAQYFNKQSDTVASSYFYRKPYAEKTVTLKLRKGIYNIGGEYILFDSPDQQGNYTVKQALLNGSHQSLEGNSHSGFKLFVNGNCTIEMILDKYIM